LLYSLKITIFALAEWRSSEFWVLSYEVRVPGLKCCRTKIDLAWWAKKQVRLA